MSRNAVIVNGSDAAPATPRCPRAPQIPPGTRLGACRPDHRAEPRGKRNRGPDHPSLPAHTLSGDLARWWQSTRPSRPTGEFRYPLFRPDSAPPATALATLHASGAVLEQPWNPSIKSISSRQFTTDFAGNYSTHVLIHPTIAANGNEKDGDQLTGVESRRSETISSRVSGVPTLPGNTT